MNLTRNAAFVPAAVKENMQKKVGYRAVDYFDLIVMKTIDARSTLITQTAKSLSVTIRIPEQFLKEDRKFYIMREHDGQIDVLADQDSDPETITFTTDRFSEYAIAYEAVNVNKMIIWSFVITGIAFIGAMICYVNLLRYRGKARLERRRRSMNEETL